MYCICTYKDRQTSRPITLPLYDIFSLTPCDPQHRSLERLLRIEEMGLTLALFIVDEMSKSGVARSDLLNDARELSPDPRSLVLDARPFPTLLLARRPGRMRRYVKGVAFPEYSRYTSF